MGEIANARLGKAHGTSTQHGRFHRRWAPIGAWLVAAVSLSTACSSNNTPAAGATATGTTTSSSSGGDGGAAGTTTAGTTAAGTTAAGTTAAGTTATGSSATGSSDAGTTTSGSVTGSSNGGAASSGSTGGDAAALDNGCSPSTATDRTSAASVTITFGGAAGLHYDPACLKVKVGTSITFSGDFLVHPLNGGTATNMGAGYVIDDTSPIPAPRDGTSATFVASVPGTYPYVCLEHPLYGMYGCIYVVP